MNCPYCGEFVPCDDPLCVCPYCEDVFDTRDECDDEEYQEWLNETYQEGEFE